MRIGFIDHHLDNWHADVYARLIAETDGIELAAAYESHREPDGDWCMARGVHRAATPDEVVAACDAVMVLAPDHAEDHPLLAAPALDSGKPVYIDKSLCHSLTNARAMVKRAAESNTPLMSASAIGFSDEVEKLVSETREPAEAVFCRAIGIWRGYACHVISPALRFLGPDISEVADTGSDRERIVAVRTEDGRTGLLELRQPETEGSGYGWSIGVRVRGKLRTSAIAMQDSFYANELRAILEFFKTGRSPVSPAEMLVGVAIEELADDSLQQGGIWLPLKA